MKHEIRPAASVAVVFLAGVGLAVILAFSAIALTSDMQRGGIIFGILVCVPIAALMLWLAFAQGRSGVVLSAQGLQLDVPLYGRHIDWADIDVAGIKSIDLTTDSTVRLGLRTNGVSVPGYKLGWFRTRDRRKILAAISDNKVIKIPTHTGYSLLLSVTSPFALGDAIRKTAPPGNVSI